MELVRFCVTGNRFRRNVNTSYKIQTQLRLHFTKNTLEKHLYFSGDWGTICM